MVYDVPFFKTGTAQSREGETESLSRRVLSEYKRSLDGSRRRKERSPSLQEAKLCDKSSGGEKRGKRKWPKVPLAHRHMEVSILPRPSIDRREMNLLEAERGLRSRAS